MTLLKPTREELATILEDHGKWQNGDVGGTRADLTRANLTGANLTRADLYGADLPEGIQILQVGPIGSRKAYLVAKLTKGILEITTGCFTGTLERFEEAVANTHGGNQYGREYQAAITMLRAWVELNPYTPSPSAEEGAPEVAA